MQMKLQKNFSSLVALETCVKESQWKKALIRSPEKNMKVKKIAEFKDVLQHRIFISWVNWDECLRLRQARYEIKTQGRWCSWKKDIK